MKVICVSQEQQIMPDVPHIEILEKVTAINEKSYCGNEYWQFAEYEYTIIDGIKYKLWYDKRDFATLPDQSAQEIDELEGEALIYQR